LLDLRDDPAGSVVALVSLLEAAGQLELGAKHDAKGRDGHVQFAVDVMREDGDNTENCAGNGG
jgi:hypothetical protein